MRLGVLGGTFDPPHIGHQILADEAIHNMQLDQVLWVLTMIPPHKKMEEITSLDHRINMVTKTISGDERFKFSRVDIDRDPPHYAVETMKILKKESPQDEFYYLMGLDSLNDLSTWHRPVDFIAICDGIIVMQRLGETIDVTKLEDEVPGVRQKLHILNTPLVEISSTDIRKRVKTGAPYCYYLPREVCKYIRESNLYRD
jgi:nicotinate-nucleotide adenylyltransferase